MLAHLLFCRGNYNIFPDTLYFNKQSQSQVRENQRKLLSDKQIRAIGHLVIGKNKANSNPIKAKTNPIQSQTKPISNGASTHVHQEIQIIFDLVGSVR
ncbi:MAG TPA: hypothetical protein VMW72_24150 [Sedimentisphaerales bacterium]|nr:hypothetical protein [Sedimentisphaerales bacterium]